jgi:DNA-directed RNA polymerase subunit RPC12/RpoP
VHGSRAEEDAAAQYKCNHCGRKRMLQEYSGVMHKKQHPQQMRCLDCQMPACRECKQRPALPLIHGIHTGTAYVCQRCVYPPYSRCRRTPRPLKKKAGTRRTDRSGYAKAAVIPKRNVVDDGITDVFLITSPLEMLGRSAPVQWTEGASIVT